MLYILYPYIWWGFSSNIGVEDQFGTILCNRIKKYRFLSANREKGLLKVVTRLGKLGKDKVGSKNNYNSRVEWEKIDELKSMKLHGQFGRDTDDKKSENSWHWLGNRILKWETERLLLVA